jgi:hypothetical protein
LPLPTAETAATPAPNTNTAAIAIAPEVRVLLIPFLLCGGWDGADVEI